MAAFQQFANSILGGRRRSNVKVKENRERDQSAPPRVPESEPPATQSADKTDKKKEEGAKAVPVSATSEIRSSWLNLAEKPSEGQKCLDPPFSKKYKSSVSDMSAPGESDDAILKLEEVKRPVSGSFLFKRQETLSDAKLRLSKNAANPLELARRTAANNLESTSSRPTVQSKVAKYQNVTIAPQAKVLPTVRKDLEGPTWGSPDSQAAKAKVDHWGFSKPAAKIPIIGDKITPPTAVVQQVEPVVQEVLPKPMNSGVENFLQHASTIVKPDECEQCGRRSLPETPVSPVAIPVKIPSSDKNETDIQKEILMATEKLLEATSKFDFEKFTQLSSQEFTCFQPSTHGNLLKGLDFHKFYFDSGAVSAKGVRTKLINPHVQLISTNVAVIAYNLVSQTVEKDGSMKLEHSQESRIWCRTGSDAKWTCVHLHKSLLNR